MSEFRIFLTDEFRKQLRKISVPEQESINDKLESYVYPQLREEPFFGRNIKKLRGYSPDIWRYRIRSFRVFCSVDVEEKTVYILTIDDRKDAYKSAQHRNPVE